MIIEVAIIFGFRKLMEIKIYFIELYFLIKTELFMLTSNTYLHKKSVDKTILPKVYYQIVCDTISQLLSSIEFRNWKNQ